MIELILRESNRVPLEAENITPDIFESLTEQEIAQLPVFLGKRQYPLGDFFEISGERSGHIKIVGDCRKVKWIGRGMTKGRLEIEGSAGMHLGAGMTGGSISVTGDAGDWLGAEMAGGTIKIGGSAGGQIGAAYRGNLTGMTGGTIIVAGNVGLEVGMRMRRGIIAINGKARDFVGLQMKGGTIFLAQGAEIRTGAWMKRGTIISLVPVQLLATFAYCTDFVPGFLPLYTRHLSALGFDLPVAAQFGKYQRFTGDSTIPGKGEILVWTGS